jgi:hypothetical protein
VVCIQIVVFWVVAPYSFVRRTYCLQLLGLSEQVAGMVGYVNRSHGRSTRGDQRERCTESVKIRNGPFKTTRFQDPHHRRAVEE